MGDMNAIAAIASRDILKFFRDQCAKLPDEAIGYIAKWIDAGAPYDKPLIAKSAVAKGHATVREEDRRFWSFASLKVVAPPSH